MVRYAIFSGYEEIHETLKNRKITGVAYITDGHTRVYKVPDSEVHKLPTDKTGHYFGNEYSGVSLISQKTGEWFVDRYLRGYTWVEV